MHLLGIALFLAYLLYTNLASDFSHSDYDDYYEQEQMDEPVSWRMLSLRVLYCFTWDHRGETTGKLDHFYLVTEYTCSLDVPWWELTHLDNALVLKPVHCSDLGTVPLHHRWTWGQPMSVDPPAEICRHAAVGCKTFSSVKYAFHSRSAFVFILQLTPPKSKSSSPLSHVLFC